MLSALYICPSWQPVGIAADVSLSDLLITFGTKIDSMCISARMVSLVEDRYQGKLNLEIF
jgi:hypothetical protein